MMYVVGDKVKVISRKTIRSYTKTDDGYRINDLLFNYSMFKFCNKTFIIRSAHSVDRYRLRLTDSDTYDIYDWVFSSDMLIPVGVRARSTLAEKLCPLEIFNEELL